MFIILDKYSMQLNKTKIFHKGMSYFMYTVLIYNCMISYLIFNQLSMKIKPFYLARSAKLPEGLYILPMFFLYLFLFFIFFLMVDFLANVAETLIEQSSPKFQDW